MLRTKRCGRTLLNFDSDEHTGGKDMANVEQEVRNDARDTSVARVDTKLEVILDDQLENRRNQLRTTLPIRRVVGPPDVAAVAVHIVTNTAPHESNLHRRWPTAVRRRLAKQANIRAQQV
jgi:hypothetical protein